MDYPTLFELTFHIDFSTHWVLLCIHSPLNCSVIVYLIVSFFCQMMVKLSKVLRGMWTCDQSGNWFCLSLLKLNFVGWFGLTITLFRRFSWTTEFKFLRRTIVKWILAPSCGFRVKLLVSRGESIFHYYVNCRKFIIQFKLRNLLILWGIK